MTTREIRIDRGRALTDQTETGHNRWHPNIPPILECDPGDEVILETRDALDGQLTPEATSAQVGQADLSVVHPLTGPVFVAGAEPGDLLEACIQASFPLRDFEAQSATLHDVFLHLAGPALEAAR